MTANFSSGGKVTFKSLDEPENSRGPTADGLIIDECGDVKELAWTEIFRPTIMDTNGWAWLLGTPKRRNWFWRGHISAKDRIDSACWQIPTLGCEIVDGELVRVPHPMENPNIPFEELQQMFSTMSERTFRQEILAEFLEDTGGVFRFVRSCASAKPRNPYPGRFAVGIDWAQTKDFTVIVIMDIDTRTVVDMIRFNKIGYDDQKEYVIGINDKWKPQIIVPEYNSIGIPITQSLLSLGLPVTPFNNNSKTKPRLVQQLQLAFEKKNITILDDEDMINELESFEAVESSIGNIRYGAPEGEDQHDDIVIALALAVEGMSRGAIAYMDSLWDYDPARPFAQHDSNSDKFRNIEDIFFGN